MATGNTKHVVPERRGLPAFPCAACGQPLTSDDLGDFGLRPPRHDESAEQYCDDELLDQRDLRHLRCLDI